MKNGTKRQNPFGQIHFRDRVVPFKLSTHARLFAALPIMAVAAGSMGWAVLHYRRVPAPIIEATVAQRVFVPGHTTPKQSRLSVPIAKTSELPRVDMIEARMDGSFDQASYFAADIDLSPDIPWPEKRPGVGLVQEGLPGKAGAETAYGASPDEGKRPGSGFKGTAEAQDAFAAVLKDIRPQRTSRLISLRTAYAEAAGVGEVRGEPINVSTAMRQDAAPISHVSMVPRETTPLQGVLEGLNVIDADRDALLKAIRSPDLKPGDKFDVILTPVEGGGRQVAMVRLRKARGEDVILARVEDQGFKRINQAALYDRLVNEALAQMQTRPQADGEAAEAADDTAGREERDLKAARQASPRLTDKLVTARVPADIIRQVTELATKNKISIDSDQDLNEKVRLVFRQQDGERDLVSVTFRTAEGEKRFYRYKRDDKAPAEFFDEKGHSVSKFLLAKPVPGARLGDGFAWRIHPILKVRKHHNGVDYAAPFGSPILAGGDGTVVLVSWQPGYGRYVRVKHDQGYFTTYAHIDKAAKGISVGTRVHQGEVIAYVGSTGLSTGPHLYYELRKNNQYFDPTTANLPAGSILTGDQLAKFKSIAGHFDAIGRMIGGLVKRVSGDG